MAKDDEKELYILKTKKKINFKLRNENYKKAFCWLINFLERLDDKDKNEVISYYSKNLKEIMLRRNHLTEDFYMKEIPIFSFDI
jgi:hypothetical protein